MGKKRGFNPIRFIFRLLLILIVTLIGFTIFVVFMLYKDAPAPERASTTTVSIEDAVNTSLDTFLADPNKTLFLGAEINQVNQLIDQSLRKTDPSSKKLIEEDVYDLIGVWIETKDDEINIFISGHLKAAAITFKTQLHLGFKIEEVKTNDEAMIVLELTTLTVGKLPLAWSSALADFILKRFLPDQDIEKVVEDAIGSGSDFNLKARTLHINIETLAQEQLKNEPQTQKLVQLFIDVLYKESDLISLEITKEELGIKANVGLLEDLTAPKIVDQNDRIKSQQEFETFIMYKSSTVLLTLLKEDPVVSFSTQEFNQMIWYLLKEDPNDPSNFLMTASITNGYEAHIYLPYTLITGHLNVEIPIRIQKIGAPDDYFQTMVKVSANPLMIGDDLLIEFESIDMGNVNLSSEQIAILLEIFEGQTYFNNQGIIIENFKDKIEYPGMNIKSIALIENEFSIFVELDQEAQLALDEIKAQLVLLSTNPQISNEINNLLDEIANPDGDVDGAVNDLLEAVSQMSEADQIEFINALIDIDPDILDGLFN